MNVNSLSIKEILSYAFSFRYAGICTIDILPQRNKYMVVSTGFDIQDDLVWFNHTEPIRQCYPTLYQAIAQYNYLVKKICETTEYFTEDFFDLKNIRMYLNTRIYK